MCVFRLRGRELPSGYRWVWAASLWQWRRVFPALRYPELRDAAWTQQSQFQLWRGSWLHLPLSARIHWWASSQQKPFSFLMYCLMNSSWSDEDADMNLMNMFRLQETTAQLMWTSVSLLRVRMEEAVRIWSTLINVCVQTASQVGGTSYLLFYSYLLKRQTWAALPPEAPHRVVSCPSYCSSSLTAEVSARTGTSWNSHKSCGLVVSELVQLWQ